MKNLYLTIVVLFLSFNALAVCDGTIQTTSLNDPVSKGPFDIEARVYRPLVAPGATFPVVFILPPVVGETPLDGALGLSLCLNGVGAYILDVLNNPPEAEQVQNLNTHEDALIRAEVALKRFIDDLQSDPAVKKSFGILGASQGGIISSYLSGVEERINASVIIAGGGNIPEILRESEQDSVKTLRENRITAFNLSGKEAYEKLIAPFITLEPLVVASNVKPNSMLLFVITRDQDVPTKNQRDLVRVVRNPEVIEINNIHVPGIVEASTVYADRILNFFKERL